ncbi:MAG: glycosyltransferase family 39 protein [Gammaproteobacteria bacterium]
MTRLSSIANVLWGNKARFSYLFLAAAILLFTLLGAREIWTQEHRWADIVSGMFFRQDFLHPYLGMNRYYDKPLLSYWLIVAVAKLTGSLTTWTLRVPSALSGLLAVWSIYKLGTKLKSREMGLMAGWLMLTTFYFLFWARTSSADMLNLAGTLFAITWYMLHREKANFFHYAVFFLIVSLTALCKGLVGLIIPLIAVFVDICLQKSWKQHLCWSLVLAAIPAALVYLFPFWASNHFGGESYGQSGLYMVFRENVLRYFQPFDHKGPIYTYFIYLPIYLLPWTFFFIPALVALKGRWASLSINSKWIAWTLGILFLFFTLSGSRRSYYILPVVPFAILFTADWLSAISSQARRKQWAARATIISYIVLLLGVDILPAWYYSQVGINRFAEEVKTAAIHEQPWDKWSVVLLDGESKLNFYLQLPPTAQHFDVVGNREDSNTASLLKAWPIMTNKPANTIFITRKFYQPFIQAYFADYVVVDLPAPRFSFLKKEAIDAPVAFIPRQAKIF